MHTAHGLPLWRAAIHKVIFEADTRAGRIFDIVLLWLILLSVLVVILESVDGIRATHGPALRYAEYGFTAVFTIEYLLRLAAVERPLLYARSFYGVIDLLSIIPTYLTFFVPGLQTAMALRVFRLLRIFRLMKLTRYVAEGDILMHAVMANKEKIIVFVSFVFFSVIAAGSLMYVIEGPDNQFTNIPIGIWWAMVTLSTVGFGDIVPQTVLGKTLASFLMLLGYGMIAVPTGLVTAEVVRAREKKVNLRACDRCGSLDNDFDARFCKKCGGSI
jgi:voltage-gated potassium channel